MKRVLILILLAFLLIPLVDADLIVPGEVYITNKINNINDFPDHTFFIVGCMINNYQVKSIESDGQIPGGYKGCVASVYVVKKTDFNESYLNSLQRDELKDYLSSNANEVINNLMSGSRMFSPFDTTSAITNLYNVELNNIKSIPDEKIIARDYSKILIPFGLTFLIELGIVFLFIRKSFWKIALYTFLINLLTWPIANLIIGFTGFIYYLFVEIGVFLIESVLLMFLLKIKYPKALLISFIANLLSALIGLFFIIF